MVRAVDKADAILTISSAL